MKRVAEKEGVLVDMYYSHISYIGYINLKSEALIVSNYHLKMGKVNPNFRIRHFLPFLSAAIQHSNKRCLANGYIALFPLLAGWLVMGQ